MAIISILVGYYWFSAGIWMDLAQYMFFVYYLRLITYAYSKTRICPAEIMWRCALLRWPRAFRLMYKAQATKMMVLYFSCGVLVIGKTVLLLVVLGRWIERIVS